MATRKYWTSAPRDPIFDVSWEPPKKRLTAEGNNYLLTHGQMPPHDSDVRADALVSGDGLVCTTTYDASNRPVHEFRSIDGKKHWLDKFKAVPLLQTALTNNVVNTRRQAQKYLAEHPDAIPL